MYVRARTGPQKSGFCQSTASVGSVLAELKLKAQKPMQCAYQRDTQENLA